MDPTKAIITIEFPDENGQKIVYQCIASRMDIQTTREQIPISHIGSDIREHTYGPTRIRIDMSCDVVSSELHEIVEKIKRKGRVEQVIDDIDI